MKKLMSIIFCMVFISCVSASLLGTFERDDCIDLYQMCDNCTYVNLTIVQRLGNNGTTFVIGENMESRGYDYNHTFCNTSEVANYRYNTCGDKNGVVTCEEIDFDVNVIGYASSDARTDATDRGIYFTGIIGILFFLAFIFSKQSPVIKWTYFIMFFLFALITLNILFVAMQTETINPVLETFFDGFTAIFWYIFWFAAGLLIIMWALAFIQTYVLTKNLRAMQKYGSPG